MKWNWGTGIAMVILLGVIGIGFLVYRTTQTEFEMVTKDYYEREVLFNEEAQAIQNFNASGQTIGISKLREYIVMEFPPEWVGKIKSGELYFYCPSATAHDYMQPLAVDDRGLLLVPINKIAAVDYVLKAHWTMDGKPFAFEQPFVLNKIAL